MWNRPLPTHRLQASARDPRSIRTLAKRLVREELLPLEQEYLAHPGHAYGVKETLNLKAVFKNDVVDRADQDLARHRPVVPDGARGTRRHRACRCWRRW